MKTFQQFLNEHDKFRKEYEQSLKITPCIQCNEAPKVKGEKYCKTCKKTVLSNLKDTGYLTKTFNHGNKRTLDHKEITHETKKGREGS